MSRASVAATGHALPTRMHHLDWIRVSAFGLLILYHVGMFYVTWDWHVKSAYSGRAIEPLMIATAPWRLTLLFLISGAATRFMMDKLSPRALAGSRSWRLLPPLLVGMFVVVPPQAYYEVVEKVSYAGSYLDFYRLYITGYGGFCRDGECLIMPTWNHLWFVAYLLIYTLLLAGLLAAGSRFLMPAQRAVERGVRGAGILIWPAIYFAVARILLEPHFEVTHDVVNDWYNHSVSFAAFLFGFVALRSAVVTEALVRLRWAALLGALPTYCVLAAYYWARSGGHFQQDETLAALIRAVWGLNQWLAIAAALGFGAKHLTRSTPLLGYLTAAVFPFYIVHQTIIVTLGYHLTRLRLGWFLEALLLLTATVIGCLVTYELVRRIGFLRPLFGLKPVCAKAASPAPIAV